MTRDEYTAGFMAECLQVRQDLLDGQIDWPTYYSRIRQKAQGFEEFRARERKGTRLALILATALTVGACWVLVDALQIPTVTPVEAQAFTQVETRLGPQIEDRVLMPPMSGYWQNGLSPEDNLTLWHCALRLELPKIWPDVTRNKTLALHLALGECLGEDRPTNRSQRPAGVMYFDRKSA